MVQEAQIAPGKLHIRTEHDAIVVVFEVDAPVRLFGGGDEFTNRRILLGLSDEWQALLAHALESTIERLERDRDENERGQA